MHLLTYLSLNLHPVMATISQSLEELTHADVRKLVMSSKTTSCGLDPIPTSLLKEHISILLPIIYKNDKPIPTDW